MNTVIADVDNRAALDLLERNLIARRVPYTVTYNRRYDPFNPDCWTWQIAIDAPEGTAA